MEYSKYTYLWPPRPETKVPRGMLAMYEKMGWVAQIKKNGTCTVVFARGDEVIFKTRHNDDHKQWTPKPEHVKFFKGRSDKWNVYVGELLHSKTPHIKDHLFLFDQIVKDGVHLVGMSFEKRHAMLHESFGGTDVGDRYEVNKNFSIAKNFTGNFIELFDHLKPEDEGLVLKNPKAPLKACLKQTANAGWQVKSRVPTKNYGF